MYFFTNNVDKKHIKYRGMILSCQILTREKWYPRHFRREIKFDSFFLSLNNERSHFSILCENFILMIMGPIPRVQVILFWKIDFNKTRFLI
jgi:hypothetical protein